MTVWTALRKATPRVVAGGLLLAVTACTALLNATEDQCATNADCAAIGLNGYTCNADRVCVRNPALVALEDGGAGCISHDQCTAQLRRSTGQRCNSPCCHASGGVRAATEIDAAARRLYHGISE